MSNDSSCCAPTPLTRVARGSSPARGGFSVRTAAAGDLPAVQALLAAARLPADDVAARFGDGFAVAVRDGGQVIGAEGIELYADGDARHGLLRSAVVDPAWRGRGVGEALTRDRLAWARRQGLADLWLLTTTAADWFPRFGFARADRAQAPAAVRSSTEFTDACPASATAMRLALGDAGDAVRAVVREKYGAAAQRVAGGGSAGCGTSCCGSSASPEAWNPITSDLYDAGEMRGVPAEALLASLGCGNPTALAELHHGEVVLDLGSGGGIDVLLSAKRVGPTGKAYGLDMTDEMLALANENKRRAGAANVEFLKGEIERVPLPDASVDVIISNCVINLSADKRRVLAESYRVLRPGGRFAVSDIVIRGDVPPELRRSMELWVGCVAGALEESEFRRLLEDAGFTEVEIEPTRVYDLEDARQFLSDAGVDVDALAAGLEGRIASAFVRARKPAR